MISVKVGINCPTTVFCEIDDASANGLRSLLSPSFKRFNSNNLITCSVSSSSSSSENHGFNVPKLEPFTRSKFERGIKEPPLIQKSENQLADYCSVLEGEDSYNCWQAYFELKDLEKDYPKEEIERLIIEAGGVKSLIGCLHGVAAIHKDKKEALNIANNEMKNKKMNDDRKLHDHIPDGLPKSFEEMEEDEKGRMPDSEFTRLLRARGKSPAWYSPDH